MKNDENRLESRRFHIEKVGRGDAERHRLENQQLRARLEDRTFNSICFDVGLEHLGHLLLMVFSCISPQKQTSKRSLLT